MIRRTPYRRRSALSPWIRQVLHDHVRRTLSKDQLLRADRERRLRARDLTVHSRMFVIGWLATGCAVPALVNFQTV